MRTGVHFARKRFGPYSEPETIAFAHCSKSVAGCFGRVVAALSAGAALSRRPSGLGADGLALGDRRAGVAAMDRFWRDVSVLAAFGGRIRGREILHPSR